MRLLMSLIPFFVLTRFLNCLLPKCREVSAGAETKVGLWGYKCEGGHIVPCVLEQYAVPLNYSIKGNLKKHFCVILDMKNLFVFGNS